MKNHNLLFAFLLALPLFIVADAPMDAAEEAEDVTADVVEVTEEEEEVVVDEEVVVVVEEVVVVVEEVVVSLSKTSSTAVSTASSICACISCSDGPQATVKRSKGTKTFFILIIVVLCPSFCPCFVFLES